MLLVLDVGNSLLVAGLFDGDRLVVNWSLATDRHKTEDEYAVAFRSLFSQEGHQFEQVTGVVICSSVPPLTPVLTMLTRRYFHVEPLVVGPGVKTGMPVLFDDPREVGADRIATALAAFSRYGGPLVVVDFGTATIFDVISAKGEYLGGAIAPGILISAEALFQRAAKLPRIELVRPPKAIGTNTVASMQAGMVFGLAGQVDELVRRLAAELKAPLPRTRAAGPGELRVIATGEEAELIACETETIQRVDPLLTLEGLRLIHERNL
ncbi:MAG: type III pantothenate kinase [Symbiobacteriia bacterium]